MADKVIVDLSMEVRDALALAFAHVTLPMGFFVQPGIITRALDERALRTLVRELVTAIVTTPTASRSPLFVFDALHKDAADFYAVSMLARSGAPAEPIAPRVDAAAVAAGALVWDVDPAEGETAIVCFALDAGEAA